MYSNGETIEMLHKAARGAVSGTASSLPSKILTAAEMRSELVLRRGYVESAEVMLSQIEEMRRLDTTLAEGVVLDRAEDGVTSGPVRHDLLKTVLCSGIRHEIELREAAVMDLLRNLGLKEGGE